MDFNDDYIPDDVYDWKEDDFRLTDEERKVKAFNEKMVARSAIYSDRLTGNKLLDQQNFRDTEQKKAQAGAVKDNLVLHVGNIRNGTTEEQFLSNFKKETVELFRLVSVKGSTFACIEFKTVHAAQMAYLMDGSIIDGRKIHIDFATEEQINRLRNGNKNEKNGGPGSPSFSRAGMGHAQSSASLDISRDAFGTQSPTMPGRGGSRSDFGSKAELTELSRDAFGVALQPSSNSSPTVSAIEKLANWRDTAPEPQTASPLTRNNANPPAETGGEESTNRKNNNNNHHRKENENNNKSGGGFASLANWRDTPQEKPTGGEGSHNNNGRKNNNNNNNKSEKKTADIGDFRNK
ncbi:hypothetical protein AGDE_04596 [Angomonas deanei]|uniref:RNA recognition motif. (A.k.a. RRM, RBD, or RNP domain), putative n=1 Tax=Angomonas deanei TaxID=59799 RepID=A0A7G2CCM4_9TRYP|nr:hypothetical protein AGDE_04596 [Angomonas deanei]CAD2217269.1 RNA recognition motif. (a.k.a. RRM, RBD, or RNP domain), putative [Angomonas deanei]|eukprot:EPY39332.1 hypothetical protein AGDE_04596 [Angomonas deanei]